MAVYTGRLLMPPATKIPPAASQATPNVKRRKQITLRVAIMA
jgi:hypothetical protein